MLFEKFASFITEEILTNLLFEITSGPNELFYSTATVDNIEIINSFTDQNLKKGS